MIERLLVANRGEIARRVFRTCRELGIGTIAVFSDADERAPHVAEADLAVRLPGSSPSETYLKIDAVVGAALAAGAGAVHPGYGFLSENAAFARAVLGAGLIWVGPPPDAIEAMGSKIAAKKLMADAGVPVLPELSADDVTAGDLPVLVKASAGGGGRGMRVVRELAGLPAAIEAASAEAAAAFGDPTVFCEPYLAAGRHVEVQVLADSTGTVWALGERECSIQRRHQKVLEEAPSPLVDAAMRDSLCAAAVAAARAIGYAGAGTVEFLADPARAGLFHFLEMNTRLQVEHPVTEAVTGVDLVRLQLAIAAGEVLPPHPPRVAGHAIEARLYAEDPARGWRPQTGTVHRFAVPGPEVRLGAAAADGGVRVDSGVEDGSAVSVHYDAMLAKVIAWAPTRREAARRLAAALSGARIHGVGTNRDLLVRVLRHPEFLAGGADTAFLERHGHELSRPLAGDRAVELSALAAALAGAELNRAAALWHGLPSGWRNVVSQPQRKSYEVAGRTIDVDYRLGRDGRLAGGGVHGAELVSCTLSPGVSPGCDVSATLTAKRHIVAERGGAAVILDVGGVRHRFDVACYGERLVCVDSVLGAVSLRPVPRFPEAGSQAPAGSLLAPMPGSVISVPVAAGEPVRAGQVVVVIEAMKMRHPVTAPADGVLTSLSVAVGDQVQAGGVLAVVAPAGKPAGKDEEVR